MAKIYEKNNISPKYNNKSNFNNTSKHYPSPLRSWDNSIYLYNKNNLKLTPIKTNLTNRLIKGFFNFYNKDLEKKVRYKRLLLRLRRLSSNKIYVSKAELKHTNNNVLVNIYVYNKEKSNYLNKLKKVYLSNIFNNNLNVSLVKTLKIIQIEVANNVKSFNNTKHTFVKALGIVEGNTKYDVSHFKTLSNYVVAFYSSYIKKYTKKLRMFYLYKQLVYINKSKFNYTYLSFLKKYLEKLHNKTVIFSIVNLKRFYLNSDIFSESVKLKITRNRRKLVKVLNKIKNKVKIYKKRTYLTSYKAVPAKYLINTSEERKVLDTLKYKYVNGFRLEARGRLTKRYTASRSLSNLKYKGSLLDIDSSYKGLSSVMLKGNLKPNTQYTKVASKTRIGSFGIKGWISSN